MTSVVSALTGSGAKKAAGAQVAASEEALKYQKESLAAQLALGRESLALQKSMFEKSLALGDPYRDAGNVALAQYESLLYGIPIEKTSGYNAIEKVSPQKGTISSTFDNDYGAMYGVTQHGTYAHNIGKDFFYDSKTGKVGFSGDVNLGKVSDGNAGVWESLPGARDKVQAFLDQQGQDAYQKELDERNLMFEGMDTTQQAEWQKSPSYQTRLDEGLKAREREASARSGVLSGRQLKGAERFGQEFAANEFGTYMDRLSGMINVGSANAGAAANLSQNNANAQSGVLSGMMDANANMAGNIGALQTNIGAARASGYLGQQAAGTNLINTAAMFAGGF